MLSQLVRAVAGRGVFYYVAIASALMILCLSANTSFVGFPVARALEAGASGYILKDTATEDLLNAIRTIREGNSYLSQKLALEVA